MMHLEIIMKVWDIQLIKQQADKIIDINHVKPQLVIVKKVHF